MGYWIIYVLCVPVLAVNLIGITAIAGKMGELDKVVGELRVGEGIGEGIGEGRDLEERLMKDVTEEDEEVGE